MSEKSDQEKASGIPAKVAIALTSAEKVVKDLNSAHSKITDSSSDRASTRVKSQTDRFNGGSQK